VTKDGNPFAYSAAAGFAFSPDDNGTYVVNLTATDKDSGVGIAEAKTITVNNVAPANIQLNAPVINENDTATLEGSFADPGILDTHSILIHWSDGSTDTTLTLSAGVLTFSAAHQYLDNPAGQPNGSYPITVIVTDKDNGSGSGSGGIQVNNVPPQSA